MPEQLVALFDFSPYADRNEEYRTLIREFAAHPGFCSATVDELELQDDFYRRPLRPEDLDFLYFKKAIRSQTVSRLPSLACNRMLLCINDFASARFPADGDPLQWQRFQAFYGEPNQLLAARLRPFLESYAFDYLSRDQQVPGAVAQAQALLKSHKQQQDQFWSGVFSHLVKQDYLQEGLRFILIQKWCLLAGMRQAVQRAATSGHFDFLQAEDRPVYHLATGRDAMLERIAAMAGVTRRSHSYWQFYLPTSLAASNLVHALAARPDRAFALYGASMAMELDWLSFIESVERACPHLRPPADAPADGFTGAALALRHERGLARTLERYGVSGLARIGQGLVAHTTLAERGRWDLHEQLKWLSAIEQYCSFAREVDVRIQQECPEIDRETFVEPREMCSTTHVHNDHRLVVIETGDMLFWGNLGMQLKMHKGDMVLIPDGRLHGSTVVSEQCTYHQPIIPNEWIAELSTDIVMPAA